MGEHLFDALILAAALGCGAIGGVFFGFSAFVMAALGRLPPAQGIAAMQSINIVVINPLFLGVFLGTGLACLGLGIVALIDGAGWLLAGSLSYVVGTVGVTMAFNVPRNEALAKTDPASAEGAARWTRYLAEWTFWNHVRTLAGLIAAGLLVAGWKFMP